MTWFGATYAVPLTDEQFCLIGKSVAILGQIELQIDALTMVLLKTDNINVFGAIANPHRPFVSKLDNLERLAKARFRLGEIDEALQRDLKAFISKLREVSTTRNHAVHGQWGVQESVTPNISIAVLLGKPGMFFHASKLPRLLEDIEKCASECHLMFARVTKTRIPDDLQLPLRLTVGSPRLKPKI